MAKVHLFSIAVVALAIVALAILIWGLDKGFDLTDGGCYVLRYQQNQPSEPCEYWFEHYLVKAAIPPSFRTVKSLRYIQLILNLISTFLFAMAISTAYKKMHGQRINPSLLALMMLAAVGLSIAGLPSELSYNSLNQFFLISSTALLVLSLSSTGALSVSLAALGGLACAMLYMIKLPSGLLFTFFGSLTLFLSGAAGRRQFLFFLSSNLLSIFLWSILFKPNFILHYYNAYHESFSAGSIHNASMLKDSFIEAVVMVVKTLAIAIPISTAFWMWNLSRDSKATKALSWSIGLFLLTVYFSLPVIDHLLGFYVLSRFFLMIIFLMFLAVMLQNFGLRGSISASTAYLKPYQRHIPMFLLLVLVPYIGAAGSYVAMDSMSKYYYVSFMGLIALLLPLPKFKYTKLLIICLSFYLTAVGLYHYVKYPFGYGPMYKQTIEYKGIKYQPTRALFLRRTEAILKRHGFNKEQGLVVAYTAPGVPYLMSTFHPGGVLWKEVHQQGYFRNLKKSELKLKPVIMIQNSMPSKEFIALFNDATGLDFEKDYYLADEDPVYRRQFTNACVFFPYHAKMPDKNP